jgi:hypothetical protein
VAATFVSMHEASRSLSSPSARELTRIIVMVGLSIALHALLIWTLPRLTKLELGAKRFELRAQLQPATVADTEALVSTVENESQPREQRSATEPGARASPGPPTPVWDAPQPNPPRRLGVSAPRERAAPCLARAEFSKSLAPA